MKRSDRRTSVAVIGKGRLGTALARALKRSTAFVLHSQLPGRSKSFAALNKNGGPDILLIATKDDSITDVARRAASQVTGVRLVTHFSGSQGPSILPAEVGKARLALHPMQTFSYGDPDLFLGISFMACTEDAFALKFARQFVKEVRGQQIIQLREEQLPLYHALAVFSSNTLVLSALAVEQMTSKLGVKPALMKKALSPLMRQTLRNLGKRPARQVLTGPIARGDTSTIAKHLGALKITDPAAKELYQAFLKFAKAKGF